MKFKKIKGFTLVELIIVMALTTIILCSIMAMSKPVNDLANIAITYDSERTVANEINNYVCQSIKYATYADIYIGYDNLPSIAISTFATSSGATNNQIKVIAIINDFNGVSISTILGDYAPNQYNGTTTNDDYGRIFMSKGIDSSYNVKYYTAMGKWYYGNNKYQFLFDYDKDASGDFNGVVNIETTTFKKGNPALTAKESSKFLNFDSSKFYINEDIESNTYIIYTNK